MLLQKLFLTCIITRTHEANLHIGIISEVFFWKFEPFREKMVKMMIYIDLDTPLDNRCGIFKYFRAVTL